MKDRTLEFLRTMSRRLSGRADCKNCSYIVSITQDGYVKFDPQCKVFLDTHHRCKGHIISITEWALRQPRFSDIEYKISTDNGVVIRDLTMFTPGLYIYQIGYKSKTARRWVRIE